MQNVYNQYVVISILDKCLHCLWVTSKFHIVLCDFSLVQL